ncbi:phosphotriesterase family protein [Agromyces archimandritae]|uniref:Phosphotriesterase-related protein n=1 Tax=Agromyces archimandritae TaxID=2781962 RepID=A0A975FJA0_9MICO|nr:phosphotriesterase-related protein [Agromyces archimandritae]QTX03543.1 phosphotriesterase-related protein [Agromyces archimandritae]
MTERTVPTFTGDAAGADLGPTLLHEHVFVRDPQLDRDLPHPEWDEEAAVERAVAGFERLYGLGVRTVVDLTVPGLGRDVALVRRVAEATRIRLVAATGYYTADVLPPSLRSHGPGRLVGGADPLEDLFLRDIREGIAGTGIRAGMLKVVSEGEELPPDVQRVFAAAAAAHFETGVPITTHSSGRGGLVQQAFLDRHGVAPDRIVIGHAGDSGDLDYLRALADAGSSLGFDRFGMAHMGSDEQRIRTLLALLEAGYRDRIVLSHDASFFSRVTPPSWRAATAPDWHMEHLHTGILPRLRAAGATDDDLAAMLVDTPRHLLAGGSAERTPAASRVDA